MKLFWLQGFIKNSGQRSLSYDASNTAQVAGGDTVEELEVSSSPSPALVLNILQISLTVVLTTYRCASRC